MPITDICCQHGGALCTFDSSCTPLTCCEHGHHRYTGTPYEADDQGKYGHCNGARATFHSRTRSKRAVARCSLLGQGWKNPWTPLSRDSISLPRRIYAEKPRNDGANKCRRRALRALDNSWEKKKKKKEKHAYASSTIDDSDGPSAPVISRNQWTPEFQPVSKTQTGARITSRPAV